MKLQASPVKVLAQSYDIPIITPESVNTDEVLAILKKWNAEAAVVVAFGQILSQKFLDLFPLRVVNVHASLLPRWRGAAPIQRAIMAGDKVTGVALQVMVKKLDAGDILGVRKVNLNDQKNANQLHDELAILGADLLHVEFMDYLRGNLTPVPQDESLVTYAPKIEKSEGQLDFNLSASELHRKVLGLSMGPGCYSFLNGKKIKIHKTRISSQSYKVTPGQIVEVGDGIRVQCGQDCLEILELQPESRPRMPFKEYLKGYPLEVGQVLTVSC